MDILKPDTQAVFEAAWQRAWDLLPADWQINFMAAPASAKYHQNYAGGLYEHCHMVGEYLYSRSNEVTTYAAIELTVGECARIALFHDLCKVGLYTKGADGAYHSDKELYKHHALLSVQRCEELGIMLSQKERVCILLHMAGGFCNPEDEAALTESDREWLANNFRVVSAVQWADMKAC